MNEELNKALQDYVATFNSGKYNEEELNSKFPELAGYDPQALKDYVATANSGKYASWDEINSKFPEFNDEENQIIEGTPEKFSWEMPSMEDEKDYIPEQAKPIEFEAPIQKKPESLLRSERAEKLKSTGEYAIADIQRSLGEGDELDEFELNTLKDKAFEETFFGPSDSQKLSQEVLADYASAQKKKLAAKEAWYNDFLDTFEERKEGLYKLQSEIQSKDAPAPEEIAAYNAQAKAIEEDIAKAINLEDSWEGEYNALRGIEQGLALPHKTAFRSGLDGLYNVTIASTPSYIAHIVKSLETGTEMVREGVWRASGWEDPNASILDQDKLKLALKEGDPYYKDNPATEEEMAAFQQVVDRAKEDVGGVSDKKPWEWKEDNALSVYIDDLMAAGDKMYDSLHTEEDPNHPIASQIGSVPGQLMEMLAAGYVLGPAAVTMLGLGMSADEMYKDLMEHGVDEKVASRQALYYAIPSSILERMGADGALNALAGKTFRKYVAQELSKRSLKDLTKAESKRIFGKGMSKYFLPMLNSSNAEGMTEIAQGTLGHFQKMAWENLNNAEGQLQLPETFGGEFMEQRLMEYGLGALGGGIVPAFNVQNISFRNKTVFEDVHKTLTNDKEYNKLLNFAETMRKKKKWDRKQYKQFLDNVEAARAAMKEIPKDADFATQRELMDINYDLLREEDAEKVNELTFRKQAIESQTPVLGEYISKSKDRYGFQVNELGEVEVLSQEDYEIEQELEGKTEEELIEIANTDGNSLIKNLKQEDGVEKTEEQKAEERRAKIAAGKIKERVVQPRGKKSISFALQYFGFSKEQSDKSALIFDRTIGNIAERQGISKEEAYSLFALRQAQAASLEGDNPLFQIDDVYHGSPVDFEKFLLGKVNRSAYGFGLYFTDNKEVAERYAKNNAESVAMKLYNKELYELSPEQFDHVMKVKGDPKYNGVLYRANLWEGKEQNLEDANGPMSDAGLEAVMQQAKDQYGVTLKLHKGVSGKNAYSRIRNAIWSNQNKSLYENDSWMDNPQAKEPFSMKQADFAAIRLFQDAGIDGFKFKDGEHNNYVVFDEDAVNIQEKTYLSNDRTLFQESESIKDDWIWNMATKLQDAGLIEVEELLQDLDNLGTFSDYWKGEGVAYEDNHNIEELRNKRNNVIQSIFYAIKQASNPNSHILIADQKFYETRSKDIENEMENLIKANDEIMKIVIEQNPELKDTQSWEEYAMGMMDAKTFLLYEGQNVSAELLNQVIKNQNKYTQLINEGSAKAASELALEKTQTSFEIDQILSKSANEVLSNLDFIADRLKQNLKIGDFEAKAGDIITPELVKDFLMNGGNLDQLSTLQQGSKNSTIRGAITFKGDNKAVISLFEDANVSTPMHELAHFYEQFLSPEERNTILDWTGQGEWNVDTSEMFARGFEKYLYEGKAPTKDLAKAFEKFKQWMKDIYKNAIMYKGQRVKLNDEMRGVFKQMLKQTRPKASLDPKVEKVRAQAAKKIEAINEKSKEQRSKLKEKHKAKLSSIIDEYKSAMSRIKDKTAADKKQLDAFRKEVAETIKEEMKQIKDIDKRQVSSLIRAIENVNGTPANLEKNLEKVKQVVERQMVINKQRTLDRAVKRIIPKKMGDRAGIARKMKTFKSRIVPTELLDSYYDAVMNLAGQSVYRREDILAAEKVLNEIQNHFTERSDAIKGYAERMSAIFENTGNYTNGVIDQQSALTEMASSSEFTADDLAYVSSHFGHIYKAYTGPAEKASAKSPEQLEAERVELGDEVAAFAPSMKMPEGLSWDEMVAFKYLSEFNEDNIADFSNAELKSLRKVMDNVVDGWFSPEAILFAGKIKSRHDFTKITKNNKGVKNMLRELTNNKVRITKDMEQTLREQAKDESADTRAKLWDKVDKTIHQYHTQNVLSVFNGLVKDNVYDTLLHPVTAAMEQTKQENKKSFVKFFESLNNISRKNMFEANTLFTMYLTQREFNDNPENTSVFPMSQFMEQMEKNPAKYKPKDSKAFKKLWDQMSDFDAATGKYELNMAKVEERLKKINAWNTIQVMDNVIADLTPRAQFLTSNVRGQEWKGTSSYFPRFSKNNSSDKVVDITQLKKVSLTSGNLEERQNTATPISFDAIGNFQKYVSTVNREYFVKPPLKQSLSTLGLMKKEGDTTTQRIAEALSTYLYSSNSDSVIGAEYHKDPIFNSFATKLWDKGMANVYATTLGGVRKAVAEFTGNSLKVMFISPAAFGKGMKSSIADIISGDTGRLTDLMELVHSTQQDRKGTASDEMDKFMDIKRNKSTYTKHVSPQERLYDRLTAGKFNPLTKLPKFARDVNVFTVKAPDVATIIPFWRGQFELEFRDITGKEFDYDMMRDEKYVLEHYGAIQKAGAKADRRSSQALNSAATSESPIQDKNSKDKIKTFMKSFATNESLAFWNAVKTLYGKGSMESKRDATAYIMGSMMQQTAYASMRAGLAHMILALTGLVPEEEDEKSGGEILGDALLRGGVDMAFNLALGWQGNYVKMGASLAAALVYAYLVDEQEPDKKDGFGNVTKGKKTSRPFFVPNVRSVESVAGSFAVPGKMVQLLSGLNDAVMKDAEKSHDTETGREFGFHTTPPEDGSETWKYVSQMSTVFNAAQFVSAVPLGQDVNLVIRAYEKKLKEQEERAKQSRKFF